MKIRRDSINGKLHMVNDFITSASIDHSCIRPWSIQGTKDSRQFLNPKLRCGYSENKRLMTERCCKKKLIKYCGRLSSRVFLSVCPFHKVFLWYLRRLLRMLHAMKNSRGFENLRRFWHLFCISHIKKTWYDVEKWVIFLLILNDGRTRFDLAPVPYQQSTSFIGRRFWRTFAGGESAKRRNRFRCRDS